MNPNIEMKHPQQPIWTRSFISIFMASLLVFTAFYLLLPTLPLYLAKMLKAGPGQIGIILAIYTFAALIIRPATGYLIDIHGRKWIYLAGLFFFALVFAGYMVAITLAGLLMLRFLHGLLWGITTTTGSTIAVDLVPANRRGEGLGYFGLASTIPMAIGPFLGLQLMSDGNYDRMFLASVILGLVGFLFALSIRHPEIPKHTSGFALKNLLEKSALPVAIILFINMITYGGVVTFISLYVKETGVGDAGYFFLVYAIGIAVTRLTSGKIFDRKGPVQITIIAFILIIAGFILLALNHHTPGFYGAAFAMGIGGGVLFPTFQAMINNMVTPNRRGAANSTLFTVLDLGIGAGMMITGYLAGKTGLGIAFLICSGLNILALALFIGFTIRHYSKYRIT